MASIFFPHVGLTYPVVTQEQWENVLAGTCKVPTEINTSQDLEQAAPTATQSDLVQHCMGWVLIAVPEEKQIGNSPVILLDVYHCIKVW